MQPFLVTILNGSMQGVDYFPDNAMLEDLMANLDVYSEDRSEVGTIILKSDDEQDIFIGFLAMGPITRYCQLERLGCLYLACVEFSKSIIPLRNMPAIDITALVTLGMFVMYSDQIDQSALWWIDDTTSPIQIQKSKGLDPDRLTTREIYRYFGELVCSGIVFNEKQMTTTKPQLRIIH